jgi:hypothetical protein
MSGICGVVSMQDNAILGTLHAAHTGMIWWYGDISQVSNKAKTHG